MSGSQKLEPVQERWKLKEERVRENKRAKQKERMEITKWQVEYMG